MSQAGFLTGLRVMELGDGIAGAGATSLLAALGAEVTTVVDSASRHRRSRPTVSVSGAPVSLISVILDRGKHLVFDGTLDHVESMLQDAERGYNLVVCDRVGGLPGPLAPLLDVGEYLSLVARCNRSGWLTISAFGLSGERRQDFATELTLAAASGMLASVRNPVSGEPLKLAGYQSLLNTAQAAALASCHTIDVSRDGDPVHMDLSAVESTIAMGPTLEASTVLLNAGGPGGAKRYGAPASFYLCRDGMIRISAMEDHQWRGVVTSLGEPRWTERFSTTESRVEGQAEVDRRIGEWTATLNKVEAETLLQANGVPATAMYSPLEILASPQLAHRRSLESIDVGKGRSATVVGLPFRFTGTTRRKASSQDSHRGRSIRGLKVAEVSHVLAAPLAGSLLGALGAEVTKLEDLERIDMYRRRGPYIDNVVGPERSSYFALVNHSKSSLAFDFDADPGRLNSILSESEVVIENLGGKRAVRLGLAASELTKAHGDVLAVSSSGFGQDGPFSAYRAYAYNLQASGCLGYLTRSADGVAAEIDLPWADLVSGYALATIVAAWAVGPVRVGGAGLDFAMADLVVSHFNEFVAAAALDAGSDATVDRANEMSPDAPSGVYETEDGWVAISVTDDDQFRTLVEVLGCEALSVPEYSVGTARFDARRIIDSVVGDASRTRKADQLARELRSAGVPAEELISPRELPECAQLVSRGFFTEVEHPEWGRRRLIGIPWRVAGQGPIALGAPPLLEPRAPDV